MVAQFYAALSRSSGGSERSGLAFVKTLANSLRAWSFKVTQRACEQRNCETKPWLAAHPQLLLQRRTHAWSETLVELSTLPLTKVYHLHRIRKAERKSV